MGAHLEQLTARFVASLACLAMVRASLSWFGISLPLPKCFSSGGCPLNALLQKDICLSGATFKVAPESAKNRSRTL
jgi:hypothetical protein